MVDNNGSNPDYYKKEIRPKMEMYRLCITGLPKEYVEYHSVMANARLLNWEKRGVIVHSRKMVDAGWMDSMMQLQAVVELPSGRLLKVQWHDSHDHGNFMEVFASGGQGYFDLDKELNK